MTKLELTKSAVKTIVGIGVAKIVQAIIQNNVEPESVAEKVTIPAASIVIGFMASDIASQYTDAKIDEMAAWYDENIKKTA